MPLDPRTPVLVGAGQAQQRVDDPTAALEPIDLLAIAAARGRRRHQRTGSHDRAGRHRRRRRHALVEVPGSRRAPRPPASGHRRARRSRRRSGATRRRCWSTGSRRQSRAGSTTSSCSAGAECVYTRWRRPALRAEGVARLDHARRPALPDRLGRRPAGVEPVRDGPSRARRRPRCTRCSRRRCAPRPAAGSTSTRMRVARLWSGFAAVAAENAHAWSRVPVHRRGDQDGVSGEPHGHLPVHEADVRQHRCRPGRGARCCAPTKRRARRACPRIAWSSRWPGPTRTITTSSPSA